MLNFKQHLHFALFFVFYSRLSCKSGLLYMQYNNTTLKSVPKPKILQVQILETSMLISVHETL